MITVIGEALVDLVVDDDDGPASGNVGCHGHLSGSPLNVAVGLARLGQPTQLLARFSRDTFGRRLRRFAADNGVGLAAAVDADEPSSLAVVSLDEQRKAHYDFSLEASADWQWQPDELTAQRVTPAGTVIVHAGSLASWMPPGAAHVVATLRRVREQATALVSYDPNVRPALLGTPARARELIEAAVAAAHLVKASDEDVSWLYPGAQLGDIARRWLRLGPVAVIITRGGDGAVAYRDGADPLAVPAARPAPLVDTIGAGDAFTSGLLDALSRAGVHDPGRLAAAELGAALAHASLVAGLTCERAGADPPRTAEVRARSR